MISFVFFQTQTIFIWLAYSLWSLCKRMSVCSRSTHRTRSRRKRKERERETEGHDRYAQSLLLQDKQSNKRTPTQKPQKHLQLYVLIFVSRFQSINTDRMIYASSGSSTNTSTAKIYYLHCYCCFITGNLMIYVYYYNSVSLNCITLNHCYSTTNDDFVVGSSVINFCQKIVIINRPSQGSIYSLLDLHQTQSFSFSNVSNCEKEIANQAVYIYTLPNKSLSLICNYFHNVTNRTLIYLEIQKILFWFQILTLLRMPEPLW
jgi:hypothetical protein